MNTRTVLLALVAFVGGFVLVALVVSQTQFLYMAYQHGGL